MSLYVYNTLTRTKEPFETIEPGRVRMYVCGPTVYAKAHIGHAMSVLIFDTIRRYLEFRGYEVRLVMNYTDVDDRIIVRAAEEGVEAHALAERYIHEYQEHLDDLNTLPAHETPRATEVIDRIIKMVQGLIDREIAYAVDGDVYFRVDRDVDYGKLSRRSLEDMQAGARIEVDRRKEHPMDFALWKSSKPGEPHWNSPWGPGRPGWHIECSAMNLEFLGEQIDIHGGGNDLIFPHHENEIAQTESLTNKAMARFWMHNGMMQLSGDKMSKSLGNLVTIEDFLARHSPDALRMMILNSGYRRPLKYRDETVEQTERALLRLKSALRPAAESSEKDPAAAEALRLELERARLGYTEAMDDDFNTAGALGHLFDLVRAINQGRDKGAGEPAIAEAQAALRELTGVLGLTLKTEDAGQEDIGPLVALLIDVRTELRNQKQWALADVIRDRLADLGVILEDSPEGTAWHR